MRLDHHGIIISGSPGCLEELGRPVFYSVVKGSVDRPVSLKFSSKIFSGGDSGGDTPVPIPNTEVKPASADGTAWETGWERRTRPDFFIQKGSPAP